MVVTFKLLVKDRQQLGNWNYAIVEGKFDKLAIAYTKTGIGASYESLRTCDNITYGV